VIVLDTNVISEVMRPDPDARVTAWLRSQPLGSLATTSVTIAEIRYGLARLSQGRRRMDREAKFEAFLSRGFSDRVYGFDVEAANVYGELIATRERAGRPLEGFDGLIAAIARVRGCTVATRDAADFDGCRVPIINPWDSASA